MARDKIPTSRVGRTAKIGSLAAGQAISDASLELAPLDLADLASVESFAEVAAIRLALRSESVLAATAKDSVPSLPQGPVAGIPVAGIAAVSEP